MDSDRPNFSRDSMREIAVAEALDELLYAIHFDEIERIDDREMQLSGVDVLCRHPETSEAIKIDEKAATTWASREISTFAFELSFLLGNKEVEGWFLQRERRSQTTHWLCVWPRTEGGDISDANDIVRLEAMLIHCKSVRRWARRMASKTERGLEDCMRLLRNNDTINEINWAGLRILISRNLPEQPINLLIPKDILRALSGKMNWQLSR